MSRIALNTAAAAALLAAGGALAQVTPASEPVAGQPMQPCKGGYQPPLVRGSQNNWVMDAYPSAALRAEVEGDVAVVITVGTNGRAIDVEVTQRAEEESLNTGAIDAIMRRARFLPALQDCKPVTGEYATVIRWRLG